MLWVRSYFVGDLFYLRQWSGTRGYEWILNAGSTNGGLYLLRSTSTWHPAAGDSDSREAGFIRDSPAGYPGDSLRSGYGMFAFAGFRCVNHAWIQPLPKMPSPTAIRQTRTFLLVVPHWFAALAALAIPVPYTVQRVRCARRARDAHSRLCPTCGYDLRATPDRCPECGAANSVITQG